MASFPGSQGYSSPSICWHGMELDHGSWSQPAGAPAGAAPRRPGHAPAAMAVHPQDTAAGIFLLCRQEGGEWPTRGSSRDRSLVSRSWKYRWCWHCFRATASPLALSSTNTLPESWVSTRGSPGSIHKLFLENQHILTWHQLFPPSLAFLLAFVNVRMILSKFIFLKHGFQVLRWFCQSPPASQRAPSTAARVTCKEHDCGSLPWDCIYPPAQLLN